MKMQFPGVMKVALIRGAVLYGICVQASAGNLSGTTEAGSTNNKAYIQITNAADYDVRKVSIRSVDQLEFIGNLQIEPGEIPVIHPGETRQVGISFDISADAPDGAVEIIQLHISSASGVFDIWDPLVEVKISRSSDIAGDGDESEGEADRNETGAGRGPAEDNDRPTQPDSPEVEFNEAFFLVRLEGEGFSPNYLGASFHKKGFINRVITVKRGKNPAAIARALGEDMYDQDICAMSLPGAWPGMGGPDIWNHLKVRIVKGPVFKYSDLGSFPDEEWITITDKGPSFSALRRGCD